MTVNSMLVRRALMLMIVGVSSGVLAQDGDSASENKIETVGEVSIIGNTELPNVSFNLPWQLPSVQNREEQSPPTELPGMFSPIEPRRHQQQVFFQRYLELDVSGFSKR